MIFQYEFGWFFFFSMFLLYICFVVCFWCLLTKLDVKCQHCHGLISHKEGSVVKVPYYPLISDDKFSLCVASMQFSLEIMLKSCACASCLDHVVREAGRFYDDSFECRMLGRSFFCESFHDP